MSKEHQDFEYREYEFLHAGMWLMLHRARRVMSSSEHNYSNASGLACWALSIMKWLHLSVFPLDNDIGCALIRHVGLARVHDEVLTSDMYSS